MSGMLYLANSTAIARPIPRDAPVTNAYPVAASLDDLVELDEVRNARRVSCVTFLR